MRPLCLIHAVWRRVIVWCLQEHSRPVDRLQSAVNSLVCVDSDISASSLYQLFHPASPSSSSSSSAAAVSSGSIAVRFLSTQCQLATELCQQCLNQQRCHQPGVQLLTFISSFYCFSVYAILLVFTARCAVVQSAVLRSHVVCLSVRLWRWWIRIT